MGVKIYNFKMVFKLSFEVCVLVEIVVESEDL